MHEKLRQAATFWDGMAQPDGVILIGGIDAEKENESRHTLVARIKNDKRSIWTAEWVARRVLPATRPGALATMFGTDGEVADITDDGIVEQPRPPIRARDDKFGAMLGGQVIDGQLFLTGYGNQVYARQADLSWTAIDEGLPGRPQVTERVFGFEAIDGFSSDHLYCVGLRGSIWYRLEGRWHPVTSPTNARLMSVHCASDGMVYACGQHGVVLRGIRDQWRVIAQDADVPYLWDVARVGDKVLAASSLVMYQVEDGALAPFPFQDLNPDDQHLPFSFFRLSGDEGGVLSVGEKDVLQIRPDGWQRIV